MASTNGSLALDAVQRSYSKLAGSLMLAAIVLAGGSGYLMGRISGDGSFAATAARIAASEHLYRAALLCAVLVTLSSILLAFTLYVTLRPVNSLLALLGMIFSLADSCLAMAVRMCSYVRLHLYISSLHAGPSLIPFAQVSEVFRTVAVSTENIGGICFGIGSCLFFYLFVTSRYIPRSISLLGFAASLIWTALYPAALLFPEHHSVFQSICFPPMALAEVVTGLYLVLFAIAPGRTRTPGAIAAAATL